MRRRLKLLLGAALAAFPVTAVAAGDAAVQADSFSADPASSAFIPPAGPMRLTREVHRSMGADQAFVARRHYAIRFVPDGAGWLVHGSLTGSEVESPPGFAPGLAELERSRSDGNLFPLRLDRAGMIVAQQGSVDPQTSARTLAAAKTVIAQSTLSEPERKAAAVLVERLQAQSRAAGGNWPVDLFRPRNAEHKEVRSIPLGNGAEGKVTVTIAAAEGPTGLVERFQRKVLTETGAISRVSIETWTLASAR